MRYADIKKASKDERQNQTTTTNIIYIKKFMFVLKAKLNNETFKLENSLNFKKDNFKLMKTIMNQLKYLIGLQFPMLL